MTRRRHTNWAMNALLSAVIAALLVTAWSSLNMTGPAAPPAAGAYVPPFTIAQAKPRIRYWWSPTRLKSCVRFNSRPFKPVRCKGYSPWFAPGRWVYVGIWRDGAGNEYPTYGEIG